MKLPWDKKHICWAIILFLTIAASVIFFMILQKWEVVWNGITILFKSLRPITYGLILAYLLNPMMIFIEKKAVLPIIKKISRKKTSEISGVVRGIAIVITWLITCLLVFALAALVLPEIFKSIEMLVSKMPEYADHILEWLDELLEKNPEIFEFLRQSVSGFTTNLTEVINRVAEAIPNLSVLIMGLSSSVYSIILAVINVFVGVIVSVYILKDKEKFVAHIKKLLYSILSVKNANKFISFFRLSHEKFGKFLTGKIFDSLIIGFLCFVILTLFNIPYSVLISVVVGVTNIIPFFGPFIGAIPSAFLVLCVDPIKCLTFVVIILLIQQFDGNILGPKILGNTTGISSFWVLFSILLGSSLFGFWGMICAVPLCAVIYTLLKEYCRKTMKRRGMDYSSESFERIDHIDDKTKAPVWFDKE